MFKGFKQIAFLTVLSRVLGMARDMAFAFFLGAGTYMDAWIIAFMIPNLSRRIFGEGAASSSLIPVYSHQLHTEPDKADSLAGTVVSVIFTLLMIIVLIGEIVIWAWAVFFSPLESTELILKLTAVMLPYMVMICLVAILAGLLNAHNHFAAPAFAPVLLNIFIISSLFFSGWVLSAAPTGQLFFVACGVLAAGTTQLGLQLWPLKKAGVKLKPAWQVKTDAFKKIIILMAPMIIGLTATQINTLADVLIARIFSGSEIKGAEFVIFNKTVAYPMWAGAASKLYYAQRLYQFPLGVFGISLATAIFPVMSAASARKDFSGLASTVSRGIKGAVFIAAPAMVGLVLVGDDLVGLLFQRGAFTVSDTAATAGLLGFYAAGLLGFFLQQLLARAFYSMHISSVPTKSAVLAVAANIMLNLILIWPLGITGLAVSTAVCSYFQVAFLLIALSAKLDDNIFAGLGSELLKTLIATAVMSASGLAVKLTGANLPPIVRITALVLICAVVYAAAGKLLKTESFGLLFKKKL